MNATWDIFCKVIDNYGDIGVCWRLARQLASEHGIHVRLWVDELLAFRQLCPAIEPERPVQHWRGVEIHRWAADFPSPTPGDVVVETFACYLPENFVLAMSSRQPRPVWVNLDYLSAEAWVAEYHALPSPHPSLPLVKYFFFPGFDEKTGGLLREAGLDARRQEFLGDAGKQRDFWRKLATPPPRDARLCLSLFCYENPALPALLNAWQHGEQAISCLTFSGKSQSAVEAALRHPLPPGAAFQRGNLELRCLPFLEQDDYDRLLWLCDMNFVRGEDSFLRAQWANRPLLWQIYPQAEDAHLQKLDAFLGRYCAGLSEAQAAAVRQLHTDWNAGKAGFRPTSWENFLKTLPELRQHAEKWREKRSQQADLCAALVNFCQSQV